MEQNTSQKIEKKLAQWMGDLGLTDAGLADVLGVSRQTVWRWREQGITPYPRDRKSIQDMAGADVIIIFGASSIA